MYMLLGGGSRDNRVRIRQEPPGGLGGGRDVRDPRGGGRGGGAGNP